MCCGGPESLRLIMRLLAKLTHGHLRGVIQERVTVRKVALVKVAAIDILPSLPLCELLPMNILRGLATDVEIYGVQRSEASDRL